MRPILSAALLTSLTLAACAPAGPSARSDYQQFCASCHGAGGRGDGPLAASLKTAPPDLTLVARRAGGTFPATGVMSVIDGYTRGQHGGGPMPEFGVVLEGRNVLYDDGTGQPVPVPERLLALATYLETLQQH